MRTKGQDANGVDDPVLLPCNTNRVPHESQRLRLRMVVVHFTFTVALPFGQFLPGNFGFWG